MGHVSTLLVTIHTIPLATLVYTIKVLEPHVCVHIVMRKVNEEEVESQ